jgi:hypothetical protein
MKCLSFGLWGADPVYNVGAIRNADLDAVLRAERTVPRWKRMRNRLRWRAGPWG